MAETGADYALFQSTLPARGATAHAATRVLFALISIHAPREGSDQRRPHPVYER